MSSFGWLITVALAFNILWVAIGYFGWKTTKSELGDYFVAHGAIGGFVLFFTSYATLLSAWTFIGLAGSGFTQGLGWAVVPAVEGLLWAMAFYYFGRRMFILGRKNKYVTAGDFLADRFQSETIRLLVAVITLVGLVPQVALQITGIGYIFSGLSGGKISFLTGVFFFLAFLAIYTVYGGFRGVAWNDVIQGAVLFIFLWIAMIMILKSPQIGGLKGIMASLEANKSQLHTLPGGNNFWNYKTWVSWTLILVTGVLAYPQLITRFYSAKSLSSIRKTAQLLPVLTTITYLPPVIVGMAAAAAMVNLEKPDAAMATMLTQFVSPAVAAVLGMGAIAAALSTVDGILLVNGAVFTRDIVQKLMKIDMEPTKLFKLGRLSVGVWILVCFAIGLWNPIMITLMSGFALRAIGLGLFLPLLCALFWPRATKEGIMSGMVVGELIGVLTVFVWKSPLGWDGIIWGLLAELLTLIVVSYATAPPTEETLYRFFDEVDMELKEERKRTGMPAAPSIKA